MRVAIAVALLTGCTNASTPDDRPDPSSSVPTDGSDQPATTSPAEQVWTLDLRVIGAPRAAGDAAVVYAVEGDTLSLVGVDAATGEQLWSQPASPGEVVPGIAIVPTVVMTAAEEPLAAYFRPDPAGNLFARLVLADPRTGEDVFATEPLLFRSPPEQCPDDRDVCFRARAVYGEAGTSQRLRLTDGTVVQEPPGPEGFVRGIGPKGLSDVRIGDLEYLARIEDGAALWQVPISDLFGPTFSTDGGWGWDYFAEENLLVGHVGQRRVGAAGSPQEQNLAAVVSVALDAATGELVWRDEGSLPNCTTALPLPRALDDEDSGVGPGPVRCRYAGGVVLQLEQDPVFSELDVTVEGYDVRTGDTTWTLPLGAVEGLVFDGGVGAVAGPQEILLPAPDGPLLVNLTTGQTEEPAEDQVLFCASERVRFDYPEPFYVDELALRERSGGTLTIPCHPDGAATSDPIPSPPVEAVAVEIADRYILATESGLVGYRLE
ncbi:MAG: PQQ-binding-like beta-propeller repeat protein [Geodermatophilaceae bacterium]